MFVVVILLSLFSYSSYTQTTEEWVARGDSLSFYEAIKCYDKAIELDTTNTEAYSKKAFQLMLIDAHGAAIDCYKKVIEINPKDYFAYYNIAYVYKKMNLKEAVIEYLKKTVEINNGMKKFARSDPAFEEYRDDPDFIELTK
jgi:tetratricopeptide (TPR) repeat protein